MAEVEIIVRIDNTHLKIAGSGITREDLAKFSERLLALGYLSEAKPLPDSNGVAVRLHHPGHHKQLRCDAQALWDHICTAKK